MAENNYQINNPDDTPEIVQNINNQAKGNFLLALFVGIIVSIACSSLWALITISIEHQFAIIAIAIGAAIGFTVRLSGRGSTIKFGILGAVLSLLSCVFGDFLSNVGFMAKAESLGFFEALSIINYRYFFEIAFLGTDIMSILFYGFAIWEGFKFSINSEG
jgi:hypothetical protein